MRNVLIAISPFLLITYLIGRFTGYLHVSRSYDTMVKKKEENKENNIKESKSENERFLKIKSQMYELIQVSKVMEIPIEFLMELFSDLIKILKKILIPLKEKGTNYNSIDEFFIFLLDFPEIRDLIVKVADFHIEQKFGTGFKAKGISIMAGPFIRNTRSSDLISYASPEKLMNSEIAKLGIPLSSLNKIFEFIGYVKILVTKYFMEMQSAADDKKESTKLVPIKSKNEGRTKKSKVKHEASKSKTNVKEKTKKRKPIASKKSKVNTKEKKKSKKNN